METNERATWNHRATGVYCSNCGEPNLLKVESPYCPHCGAKMEVDDGEKKL